MKKIQILFFLIISFYAHAQDTLYKCQTIGQEGRNQRVAKGLLVSDTIMANGSVMVPNGLVGIGTTAPQFLLHVQNVNGSFFGVGGAAFGQTYDYIFTDNSTYFNGVYKDGNGNGVDQRYATNILINANDSLLFIAGFESHQNIIQYIPEGSYPSIGSVIVAAPTGILSWSNTFNVQTDSVVTTLADGDYTSFNDANDAYEFHGVDVEVFDNSLIVDNGNPINIRPDQGQSGIAGRIFMQAFPDTTFFFQSRFGGVHFQQFNDHLHDFYLPKNNPCAGCTLVGSDSLGHTNWSKATPTIVAFNDTTNQTISDTAINYTVPNANGSYVVSVVYQLLTGVLHNAYVNYTDIHGNSISKNLGVPTLASDPIDITFPISVGANTNIVVTYGASAGSYDAHTTITWQGH